MQKFLKQISKYGHVHVAKKGVVFTVFLTGTGLANMQTVIAIGNLVTDYAGSEFSKVELMKNDDDYFLIILKP